MSAVFSFCFFRSLTSRAPLADLFGDLPRILSDSRGSSPRINLVVSKRFDPSSRFKLFQHGAHLILGLPFSDGGTSSKPYPRDSANFSPSLAEFNTWDSFSQEYKSWGQDLPNGDVYADWVLLRLVFIQEGMVNRNLAKWFVENGKKLNETAFRASTAGDITLSISHQVRLSCYESRV